MRLLLISGSKALHRADDFCLTCPSHLFLPLRDKFLGLVCFILSIAVRVISQGAGVSVVEEGLLVVD